MENIEPHFTKTFWFIVYITSFVFAYLLIVTFYPIPEKNIRFVDTSLGFLLGTVLAGGISWLVGGSPDKKKEAPVTDNSTSIQSVDTLKVTTSDDKTKES